MYYWICCFVLFFIAASASFNGFYDKWHLIDVDGSGSLYGKNTFASIVDGSAQRPYVYRQLLPVLAGWIDRFVSNGSEQQLDDAKNKTSATLDDRLFDTPIAQNKRYFSRYKILYGLVFLFAWASVYAMYGVARAVGSPPAAAAMAAVSMILLVPYFLTVGGYFYDYPELAFFMFAVWAALKLEWWWMVPLSALATWNKESFLLFVPTLYPLLRQHTSRIKALGEIGILSIASGAVCILTHLHYRNNPGGVVEFQLMRQISSVPDAILKVHLDQTYGVSDPLTENLVSGAFLVWTLARGWRLVPGPVQRHAQIAAIINIPLFICFCMPYELRDLSMLYVALLLLLAANLTQWLRSQFNFAEPKQG
jgi:hypothetical protein